MIKNICIYITFVLSFVLSPSNTFALETKSYLITEPFEINVPSDIKTYFHKTIQVNYQSGKVVLSLNPDGTGETQVGESIHVVVNGDNYFEVRRTDILCNPIQMPPLDITHLMDQGNNSIRVGYRRECSPGIKSHDQLYLVHFDDYEISTTPFLDLPWDYKNKNMSFDDAATKISSYFDHAYPIVSADWFLDEPEENSHNILDYFGNYTDKGYSSHDGYDYAFDAGVSLNTPVLAAASGYASFHNECSACGNAIHIDHGNGYQTRYYHLQPDQLIVNVTGKKVQVSSGQQIGKTGYSGNVVPFGKHGSHIHFMLIQDKDGDGNFDDNIPDGVVDPYGWHGNYPDPWEQFSYSQNGGQKTGAKSRYLWKNNLSNLKKTLPPEGGSFASNRFTFNFPPNITQNHLIFSLKSIPLSTSSQLDPIGYVVEATADDGFGNLVTHFNKLFTISMKFMLTDYTRYRPESLSIYSSQDGITWQKESTSVDLSSRTATTQVDHLTYFAFMGEKKDTIAPHTTLLINNKEVGTSAVTFSESLTVSLEAADQPLESLGIEHTFIQINDQGWQLYQHPIELTEFGEYTIQYYSEDKDGNREEVKINEIGLKEQANVPPEFKIYFNTEDDTFQFETVNVNDMISSQQIKKKRKVYTQYSASNNDYTTKLMTFYPERNEKNIVRFHSLQYDNTAAIQLERYRLVVFNKTNKKDIEKLIQVFQHGEEERIRLSYNSMKDTTTVVIKNNGKLISKERIDGFKILTVNTHNGDFTFSIE